MDNLPEDLETQLKIYHKLAGIYGWDWKSFKETPWWVVKGLCKLLDEKSEDMNTFISWSEYMEYRNLKRLHGTKEE